MTHMSEPHPTNADELLDPIGSSAVAAFESDDWLALSARARASSTAARRESCTKRSNLALPDVSQ